MGRPKGLPKTGGRAKGTKNRRTVVAEAFEIEAVGKGMKPLAYMLKVMRAPKEDKDRRLDAAKSAAPYLHPKLAAVVMRGPNDDGSLTFNVNLNGADARA